MKKQNNLIRYPPPKCKQQKITIAHLKSKDNIFCKDNILQSMETDLSI